MPRAGLSASVVSVEAGRLADEVGLDNLTLAALAQRLGVRQPSLYKHVDGLAGLHREIAIRAKMELAEVMRRAAVGRARDDAISAIAVAYRDWAISHPGRYAATARATAPGDGDDRRAGLEAVEVVFNVLQGYGLTGTDAVHATRALRAALHGFVTLQASGGFGLPADVDTSFRRTIRGLIIAVEHWHETRGRGTDGER